jgi:hypothetical protein
MTTNCDDQQSISGDLIAAFKPIIEHLQQQARQDSMLRQQLHDLAATLLSFTEGLAKEIVPVEAVEQTPSIEIAGSPASDKDEGAQSTIKEPRYRSGNGVENDYSTGQSYGYSVRETLRVVRPVTDMATWRSFNVTDDDLSLISERCRLKAEGARWSAIRHQRLRDGADYDTEIEPQDRDIIARAKMLPDCFIWMCNSNGPTPADLAEYETLAGCFEAVAATATLLDQVLKNEEDEHDVLVEALELAAEAQSALRIEITSIGGNTDSDQYKLFQWLKNTGAERQILIRHYMRKDDPADPMLWPDLLERVRQYEERLDANRNRSKRQRSLFSKLRYHLKLIESNRGQDRIYDWQKVNESVEELVNDGLPASNRELRDLVLPIADEIPETIELSKNLQLVLRELEQYLTSRAVKHETESASTQTEDVRRTAEMLQGRSVVLIGGLKRPLATEALVEAFGLRELIWVEGRDQTYQDFEPDVARPEVAAVLLAIRWSRHGFGEVKAFCDKYDKPLVRLPGGYSPNLVAHHILSQIGERLAHRSAELV